MTEPGRVQKTSVSGLVPSSATAADPLDLLPSSPSQTYLNLLVLEANLRSQYLNLLARRRQNVFVLTVLTGWLAYFGYAQWFRPREDGTGVGGSVYWLVDTSETVALIGGIVMALLFWMTGQWERGIRWPRRWLTLTNRGLRTFNCKLVLVPRPWWRDMLSSVYFFIPYAFFITPGMNFQLVDARLTEQTTELQPQLSIESRAGLKARRSAASLAGRPSSSGSGSGPASVPAGFVEEDLAPGGNYVKLVLLPKPFSPDFREKWEIFRSQFWVDENHRRAELSRMSAARNRQLAREARQARGWLGWLRPSTSTIVPSGRAGSSRAGSEPGSRPSSASGHGRQLSVRASKAGSTTRRRRRNSTASQASSVGPTVPPLPTVTGPDEDWLLPDDVGGTVSRTIRLRSRSTSTTGSSGSVSVSVSASRSGRLGPLSEVRQVGADGRLTADPASFPILRAPGAEVDYAVGLKAGVVQRRKSSLSVAGSTAVTDPSSVEDEPVERGRWR